MYYAIECLATTKSQERLYVTDAYPELTATTKQGNRFRGDQLWQALYNPNNGGVSLKNKESGNLIAVQAGNTPALLVPDTIENRNKLSDPSAVLNIVGNKPEGYRVVRGLQDQDNNMDLAGNPDYVDGVGILFWKWYDNDNYKWKFIEVEA